MTAPRGLFLLLAAGLASSLLAGEAKAWWKRGARFVVTLRTPAPPAPAPAEEMPR